MSALRRAVAYIRIAEPVTEPTEADRQRAAIAAWAARESVDVASWQVDVGVRGATPIAERPGLLAAYRAISPARAGLLVAANASRFSRDELVSWLIERAALSAGAVIATADGSWGARAPAPPAPAPAPTEGWSRGALELARAHQRVTQRARIRASLAERRARGERVGNVPYGFQLAADGRHLELEPREQAVIAEVRRLSAEGLSQRAIVARLGEGGVVGRSGAPLQQTQVGAILRRPPAP